MKKYPSIRYPNEPETDGLLEDGSDIIVMEKLDGANFRFHFDEDGNVVVGTRNVEYEGADDENLDKNFVHAIEYLEHALEDVDTTHDLLQNITFYGEAMHEHTIDYDAYDGHHPHPTEEDCPNVLLFDAVADEGHPLAEPNNAGTFIHHDDFLDMVDNLPLKVAPILHREPAAEFNGHDIPTSRYRIPDEGADSEFDREGLAEGVVYKRADGSVRAKKVHPQFKEQHSGPSGRGDYSQTNAGLFVEKYVTEARIKKMIQKLANSPLGNYESVQMEMMEDLPRIVLTDVMEENGWELLNNDFECEFDDDFKGEVRSKTSKKCARILKQECQSL
jgi:hypothetical protein